MTENQKRAQRMDQALMIMQQQLKLVFQTFQSNVEAALEADIKKLNISYLNVFREFNVPLSTLVDIALEISPTCLMTDQKFSRKRALVVPRQILCYIAGEMGYKDSQIAYVVNRDRTTVIIAKGVVLDALTYGTVEYVKTMQQFTTRLKNYSGGDVLKYLD